MAKPVDAQQWITMVDPVSRVRTDVPLEDVGTATDRGLQVETAEQAATHAIQASPGSVAEGIAHLAERAAGSASFGATDALLAGVPGYREGRQRRDIKYPISGAVGEAVGYVAPGLGQAKLAGTAGKVARAIAAPVSTVSRGARAAGGAVERFVAGGSPGAARALFARGAKGVTAGAIEGGAIGVQRAVSESAIQDKQLSAELLLSHVRDNAAIGGTMGGGIEGALGLMSSGARAGKAIARHVPGIGEVLGTDAAAFADTKALASLGFQRSDMKRITKNLGRDAVPELGREATSILGLNEPGAWKRSVGYEMREGAEKVAARKSGLNDELLSVYERSWQGARPDAEGILNRVDSEIGAALRNSLDGDDVSGLRAINKSVQPLRIEVARARQYTDAARAVPVIEERLGEIGTFAARRDYASLRQAHEALIGESQEMIGRFKELRMRDSARLARQLVRTVGEAAESNGFGIQKLMGRVRTDFDALAESVGRHVEARGVPNVTYNQIWELAKKQADKIKNFAFTRDPKQVIHQKYRQILKDELQAQAERVGLGEELKSINHQLRNVIALDDVAKQAGSFAGNRSVSLSDTITGSVGAGSGAAIGGPIGAALGGAASATVNRFIRSAAGDQMLAVMANKYSNWRNVVHSTDRATEKLARETASLTEGRRVRPSAIGFSTRLASEYNERRNRAIELQANQDRIVDQITANIREVRDVSPELADATVSAAARGNAYLASTLPNHIGFDDLKSAATKGAGPVPDSVKAKFVRDGKVVDKPGELLRGLKKGTVTPGQVDALRSSYPALYGAIQGHLLTAAVSNAANGKIPNYQRRLDLSMVTGVPLDASARPEVIAAYQAMHATNNAQQAQSATLNRSGGPSKFASRRESPTERQV